MRANRERKSIGAETTFATDLTTFDAMVEELRPLIEKVWRYCASGSIRGRTVTLKVKYADFTQITRSRSSSSPISEAGEVERISRDLLKGLFPLQTQVRLLGVTLSSLTEEAPSEPRDQLDLGL